MVAAWVMQTVRLPKVAAFATQGLKKDLHYGGKEDAKGLLDFWWIFSFFNYEADGGLETSSVTPAALGMGPVASSSSPLQTHSHEKNAPSFLRRRE
jgi:hypothetical protein